MDRIGELDKNNNNQVNNKIKLIYKAKEERNYNLFGSKFVENNINNIKLYINKVQTSLIKEYKLNKGDNVIIMEIINPIKNLECMFYNCNCLTNINDLFLSSSILFLNQAAKEILLPLKNNKINLLYTNYIF